MDMQTYRDELRQIRDVIAQEKCQSQTSIKFQDDIFQFILDNQKHGRGVIEVGCYKGGSSAILAVACNKLGWPLYIVDISIEYLNIAKDLLNKLDLAKETTFFHGTLQEFVAKVELKAPPLLVVIDGDHVYEGVLKDIKSLYSFSTRSFAAAFHDFSLRHNILNERVDKAILDFFGKDIPLIDIGVRFDENTTYPLKSRPNPDGHYCELDGPEGVIVKLPESQQIHHLKKELTFLKKIKNFFRLSY